MLALVALCGSLGVGQGQGPCASMQCCTGGETASGDTCSCSWAFRPLGPCTGLDALLCCPGSSWCQYAEQSCCSFPQSLSSSQHWRFSPNTKPPQTMRLCCAEEVPDLLPQLMERIMWGMQSQDSDIKTAAITAVSTAAAAVEATFAPFAEHVVPVLAGFMQQTEVGTACLLCFSNAP